MNSAVLSEQDISRAITRITHEILEKNKGATNLVLVGIRTRGATLAKRIVKKIITITFGYSIYLSPFLFIIDFVLFAMNASWLSRIYRDIKS